MTDLWVIAGFFVFVLAAVFVAGYLFANRRPKTAGAMGAEPSVLVNPAAETEPSPFVQVFQRVGENMPGAKKQSNPLRKQLMGAGYRLPSSLPMFYGIKFASAMSLAIIALWAATALGKEFSEGLIPALCGAGFGYMLPDRFLRRAARARAKRLRVALPPALDMLVLTIEAGQPLDQAVLDTSRALKSTHPELSSELALLYLESRTATGRTVALRNFAERNQELELKKFSSLLNDTDRFGASIGPALRNHAKYLRIRFRQQAQETARKVGVKLIFPVFFLIFPSVILVTLGPACILIFTQMRSVLGP